MQANVSSLTDRSQSAPAHVSFPAPAPARVPARGVAAAAAAAGAGASGGAGRQAGARGESSAPGEGGDPRRPRTSPHLNLMLEGQVFVTFVLWFIYLKTKLKFLDKTKLSFALMSIKSSTIEQVPGEHKFQSVYLQRSCLSLSGLLAIMEVLFDGIGSEGLGRFCISASACCTASCLTSATVMVP